MPQISPSTPSYVFKDSKESHGRFSYANYFEKDLERISEPSQARRYAQSKLSENFIVDQTDLVSDNPKTADGKRFVQDTRNVLVHQENLCNPYPGFYFKRRLGL